MLRMTPREKEFSMNSRERFLAACRCKEVDRPPVWLMRQAGRYLPEYRELRARHSFWQMMREPELAVKVTLQPLERYDMDAAILFSDILTVQDALGFSVEYESSGPRITPLVTGAGVLDGLGLGDDAFGFVRQIVSRLAERLHPEKALIGFAGAPFTLAAYCVERGPQKSVKHLLELADEQPEVYERLLELLSEAVERLCRIQVEAGADAVQLFDTWAGKLDGRRYSELAAPWTKRLVERLKGTGVPVIVYLRNCGELVELAAACGPDVVSVDDSISLPEARRRIGTAMAIQGNFSPSLLFEDAGVIRKAVHEGIESAGSAGYIVNLGQGLTPDVPPEGVGAFVEAVKSWQG